MMSPKGRKMIQTFRRFSSQMMPRQKKILQQRLDVMEEEQEKIAAELDISRETYNEGPPKLKYL